MSADVTVDTRGMNCPQPLVEVRKKLRKMQPGQVLEIVGDHKVSRTEIPMTMEENGDQVLEAEDNGDGSWKILVRKGG
jgi:TusA-related sulfurtransferase